MNRKADINILVSLVVAFMILTLLHNTVYAKVIKPILYDNTRSASYDNFVIFTGQLQNLIDMESQSAMDNVLFEIEDGFTIMSFAGGANYDGFEMCGPAYESIKVAKPKQCKDNPCICLFKGELKEDEKKNNINDKLLVGECFIPEADAIVNFYSRNELFTCFKLRTEEFPKQIEEMTKVPPGESSVSIPKFEPFSIEKSFSTSTKKNYFDFLVFVKTDSSNPDRIDKKVFIMSNEVSNREIYKFSNICPEKSYIESLPEENHPKEWKEIDKESDEYKDCVGKHYDKVITKTELKEVEFPPGFDSDLGRDEETGVAQIQKKYSCKYNQELDICLRKEIDDCCSLNSCIKKITEECACGEVSYDEGFCTKYKDSEDKEFSYVSKPMTSNLCLANEVDECSDYSASGSISCAIDYCSVSERGCYWKEGGWGYNPEIPGKVEDDDCKECPDENGETCDCDIYASKYMNQINPCGCRDDEGVLCQLSS
ncbi:hypothetical protein ACFLTH_12600 [Bacteroidota bacterium]